MTALAVASAALAVACLARARALGRGGGAPPGTVPPGAVVPRLPRTRAAVRAAELLADAGIEGDPARWARLAGAGVAAGAGLAGLRGGPPAAVVVAAVAVAALGAGLHLARGRGARRADARLPDLLEHAGRGLRSGLDLATALREAADRVGGLHGGELHQALDRAAGGAGLVAALGAWERAHPRPPVRLAVASLEVAADAGGGPARALDGVAATLRGREAVAAETRALAVQAQASAAVLVALPVVVAVLGAVADPRLAGALLGTGWGLTCVVVAAALDGAGAWWMHRIVAGPSRD